MSCSQKKEHLGCSWKEDPELAAATLRSSTKNKNSHRLVCKGTGHARWKRVDVQQLDHIWMVGAVPESEDGFLWTLNSSCHEHSKRALHGRVEHDLECDPFNCPSFMRCCCVASDRVFWGRASMTDNWYQSWYEYKFVMVCARVAA